MAALFDASPKRIKRLLQRAEKARILKSLPTLHNAAFSEINCLDCAKCCKGYSPRFKTPDITRIAKFLGMKQGLFVETYLRLDTENDYVTQRQPCPFLAQDNTCNIYDVRPSDCARFPYTDEDVFIKRPALTAINATFCPAVQHVLENIEKQLS
jgi:Fe-S-cluster containining protein